MYIKKKYLKKILTYLVQKESNYFFFGVEINNFKCFCFSNSFSSIEPS